MAGEAAEKPVRPRRRKGFLTVLLGDGRELAWPSECMIGSWVTPGQGGGEGRPLRGGTLGQMASESPSKTKVLRLPEWKSRGAGIISAGKRAGPRCKQRGNCERCVGRQLRAEPGSGAQRVG